MSRFLAIKRDVTAREQVVVGLRESEARAREIFASAPDGVLLLDGESGRVAAVNLAIRQMLGYPETDLLGKLIWEIPAFTDPSAVRASFEELRVSGHAAPHDLSLKTRDGKLLSVECATCTYRSGGRVVMQYHVRDVTAWTLARSALATAHDRLAVRVTELEQRVRETALLNDMAEMLQTCVTLDEAHRVIGQFAPQLFPTEPGLIGVLNADHTEIEPVVTWGEPAGSPAEPGFPVDDCWALRRGQPLTASVTANTVVCRHLRRPTPSAYVCIPLSSQNEAFGLLHLREPAGSPGRLVKLKQQLAVMLARHVELALANLELRETLRHQSIRDSLTGLYNRRYMEESLGREVARAARSRHPLGIIMIDLDHFKAFNDSFGHQAGDALLRELGTLLRTKIRTGDIACRYGGEEFTLIVTEASPEAVRQRAEHLRELVSRLSPCHNGRVLGPVSVSLGVALFPEHGTAAADVLRAADRALYRAKSEGRNRVVVAA